MLSVNPGCMWLCVAHAVCRVSALLFIKKKTELFSCSSIVCLCDVPWTNNGSAAERNRKLPSFCTDPWRLYLYFVHVYGLQEAAFVLYYRLCLYFLHFSLVGAGEINSTCLMCLCGSWSEQQVQWERDRSTAKQCITYQMINWYEIELPN